MTLFSPAVAQVPARAELALSPLAQPRQGPVVLSSFCDLGECSVSLLQDRSVLSHGAGEKKPPRVLSFRQVHLTEILIFPVF